MSVLSVPWSNAIRSSSCFRVDMLPKCSLFGLDVNLKKAMQT